MASPVQEWRAEKDQKRGAAVVAQARDDSWMNTEPALVAGSVVSIIGAVGSILVIGGWIDVGEVESVKNAAGVIVPAAFVIAGVVQAVWTRMKAYSPRTAARIAIENAEKPAGALPTLLTPP